jgi:hypothetical protein
MNTRFTALALVTFAMLGTACDPEPVTSANELSFRDDGFIDPSTTTTGGITIKKGGHWLSIAVLEAGYDRASFEIQQAFESEIEMGIHEDIVKEFLSDEKNLEACPWTCEDAGMQWNEGVFVGELTFEHGAVTTERDEFEQLCWQTEVSYSAEVGCGCE